SLEALYLIIYTLLDREFKDYECLLDLGLKDMEENDAKGSFPALKNQVDEK
ncbi:hypothetical protein J1N35_034444, partial [Gossypium stocksii]